MRQHLRHVTAGFLIVAFGSSVSPALADVKFHPLFTDHMVLQRATAIPIWGTAEPGESVSVKLHRRTADWIESNVGEAVADSSGAWKTTLPLPMTYGPYELTVSGKNTVTLNDVLIGEVWICSGQSNMEWPMKLTHDFQPAVRDSANPMIRLYTVERETATEPKSTLRSAKGWQVCGPESVRNFSAVGYYFGRDLESALKIPVGLIHTSWGGTPAQAWTSKPSLEAVPALQHYHAWFKQAIAQYDPEKAKAAYDAAMEKWKDDAAKAKEAGKPEPRKPQLATNPVQSPHAPSSLYNAMLAPLAPFSFRGVIWYQGESNSGSAYEYRTLFPTMISDWRRLWGRDLPFLCVQLAPFKKISKEPQQSDWAELREAQWMATRALPGVGMAVITDVGDENDIHPQKKQPVGSRLALLARKIAYCQPIVADGPTYRSMSVDGNRIVLHFDNVGSGLECRGDRLTGFTIAGADRKFVNADAEIHGNSIVVHSLQVSQPAAVRFGWANFPVVNLWNRDGLPATPFRTDDWPGVTAPKGAAR